MAGGKGLRMRPFTNLFPKAMLPFNNSTIIEEIIKKFKKKILMKSLLLLVLSQTF